ncbi:Uncharacterised protein [uncultured archaeon]|nr:Uncharacterised protein [uncultured archaeon]
MAFALECEALVPAEGSAHNLIIPGQRLLHALKDPYGCCRRREIGAEVSIGVEHDASGMNLPC